MLKLMPSFRVVGEKKTVNYLRSFKIVLRRRLKTTAINDTTQRLDRNKKDIWIETGRAS